MMGIVNVTPDSFSDGGQWLDVAAAESHALAMVAAGATWIDIDGESTRPERQPYRQKKSAPASCPSLNACRPHQVVKIS